MATNGAKNIRSSADHPFAPSLEINTVEFPNQDVLPTGYNITITCTSNYSKNNWGFHDYGQPFWIQRFFNEDYLGDCGGGDGDSEDSKVCTFVIQNATERDSGNYSCVTRNQLDCTAGTIFLYFEKPSPPQFTLTPPHHMNVSAGSSVNLTCKATAILKPVISWYKDGQRVPRGNITEVNGISLLPLKNVQPHDQGEYWCQAENAEGWSRTSSTRLKLFSKPTILLHPKDFSIYLADKAIAVIFTCEATGFPPPVISWLKNNLTVTSGTLIKNGSISSLVLRVENREEPPGKYRCIAENSLGETSSKEAALVIRPRTRSLVFSNPTILLHPKDVSIYLEDKAITVIFTCEATGFPPPVISWLKNNSTVTSGTLIQNGSISSLVLRVQDREEPPAKYRCIAENSLGETSSTEAALVIRPRTRSLDDISTSLGVSRVVWISVAIGTVLLFAVVVSICLVHNKCKKANYEINKEMKEEQRFPHLHIGDTAGQLRDDRTVPRYQMTNMA
ncbi:peroxidasin-like protein isoform X3 [Orbicella faveolata]|uniref:peroxidasin-like protein isoform X3 n=1 Tax=Orbicella faveolata TaxID=48498 RepID=UPI0009E50A2E|nr:peroxidasin-like protein isoform X3 [Orbicella faveolata]